MGEKTWFITAKNWVCLDRGKLLSNLEFCKIIFIFIFVNEKQKQTAALFIYFLILMKVSNYFSASERMADMVREKIFLPGNVIFAVEMLKFLHENGISLQK